MKSLFLSLLSVIACCATNPSRALAQMNTAAAEAVFEISPTVDHKETATTFLAQVGDKTVWVTARHVFEGQKYPAQTTVFMLQAGEWKSASVAVTYSPVYDLAILTWAEMPGSARGLPICDDASLHIGFETVLYFLGFPFGQSTDATDGSIPPSLPLVKRAWLAGSQKMGFKDHPVLVLDAINNYGFSGGPIIRYSVDIKPFQACLVAVTVGFRGEYEPVVSRGRKSEASVLYNTGLMYGVPANEIVKLVAKPEGAAK